MRLSSMGQLAAAVKESIATITVDRQTEDNGNRINNFQSSVQNRYIDTVEFSDKALELYMDADTETSSRAESNTDSRQKENSGANHQQQEEQEQKQPVPNRATLLNVVA